MDGVSVATEEGMAGCGCGGRMSRCRGRDGREMDPLGVFEHLWHLEMVARSPPQFSLACWAELIQVGTCHFEEATSIHILLNQSYIISEAINKLTWRVLRWDVIDGSMHRWRR